MDGALRRGSVEELEAARVDIVKRTSSGGFDMIEVKSGAEVKEEYLQDAALQYACLSAARAPVERVYIQHLDTKKALLSLDRPFEVFTREDVTEQIQARALAVVAWVTDCARTLEGPMPQVKPGPQCNDPYECPFSFFCGKVDDPTDTDLIAFLPSKAGAVKVAIQSGKTRIGELPEEAFTHERNALVRDAINANGRVIRPSAREAIRRLGFPRFFMDFESASFAVPRFVGMRPYQPVTFQYSVHSKASADEGLRHEEFLDDSGQDPRRGFIESLLLSLGEVGPVMVFSPYEKSRLKELATLYADLSDRIQAVIARLVDLLPVARNGYYHPMQRGSWSIKKIQATMPKDAASTSYAELDGVADGMAAQAAYMALLNPMLSEQQRQSRRDELLRYCGVDTLELARFCGVLEAAA